TLSVVAVKRAMGPLVDVCAIAKMEIARTPVSTAMDKRNLRVVLENIVSYLDRSAPPKGDALPEKTTSLPMGRYCRQLFRLERRPCSAWKQADWPSVCRPDTSCSVRPSCCRQLRQSQRQ